MQIEAVGKALPAHFYDQATLTHALKTMWAPHVFNPKRLEALHQNVMVGGRHLALPLEDYPDMTFGRANAAFIDVGTQLAQKALEDALAQACVAPEAIDHIFFVTVTGLATPSIDALLLNRMPLRTDIKRTPIFGLGCVAGAAGVARAADYVKAFPHHRAALVSVELCTLTLQQKDFSVANLIASGLFGDGAAAVIISGDACHVQKARPKIIATRSVFYPNTQEVMGWDISEHGFRVILSSEVPAVVGRFIGRDVDAFLQAHQLKRRDIARFVCHPGGPKVLDAIQNSLGLDASALDVTRKSLLTLGNLSSASVLMVLGDVMGGAPIEPGSWGLMMALGPGFCSELVLLRW